MTVGDINENFNEPCEYECVILGISLHKAPMPLYQNAVPGPTQQFVSMHPPPGHVMLKQ